jgi:hypothetical protein
MFGFKSQQSMFQGCLDLLLARPTFLIFELYQNDLKKFVLSCMTSILHFDAFLNQEKFSKLLV